LPSSIKSKLTEVEEVLDGKPKFRFVEKGERKNEDVYMALGQTEGGRYLIVLFIYKQSREALILSAREMEKRERKNVWQKIIRNNYRNSIRLIR